MPRRLVLVNLLLGLVSLACLAFIVRELATPPAPTVGRARPSASPAPAEPGPARPPASAAAYGVVATKNLFSPTRSEAPVVTSGGDTPTFVKPTLHGVVLRSRDPIAYLEDPATKRVSGYRVGDSVSGATVREILADHVVMARGDSTIDVRLRDPSKPRPAPQPVVQPTPGVPVPGAVAPVPGTVPPGVVLPPTLPQPVPTIPRFRPGLVPPRALAPGMQAPVAPGTPLPQPGVQQEPSVPPTQPPPGLLRRIPAPPMTDAPGR